MISSYDIKAAVAINKILYCLVYSASETLFMYWFKNNLLRIIFLQVETKDVELRPDWHLLIYLFL